MPDRSQTTPLSKVNIANPILLLQVGIFTMVGREEANRPVFIGDFMPCSNKQAAKIGSIAAPSTCRYEAGFGR